MWPLYALGGEDAVPAVQALVEHAVLQGEADNLAHVVRVQREEVVRQVFVEHVGGLHVVALPRVDGAIDVDEHRQRGVAPVLHDASHGAVVDKLCVERKIVQPGFLDSCHSSAVFFVSFQCFPVHVQQAVLSQRGSLPTPPCPPSCATGGVKYANFPPEGLRI